MMANPKLLCLDEPSLGLAPAVIEDALETLAGFVRTICPGAKIESAML